MLQEQPTHEEVKNDSPLIAKLRKLAEDVPASERMGNPMRERNLEKFFDAVKRKEAANAN